MHQYIDAKTNTTNWIRAFQTEDLEEKEELLVEAIANVKTTTLNLSFKPYDQLDNIVVPNLIIMYMPLDTMYRYIVSKGIYIMIKLGTTMLSN